MTLAIAVSLLAHYLMAGDWSGTARPWRTVAETELPARMERPYAIAAVLMPMAEIDTVAAAEPAETAATARVSADAKPATTDAPGSGTDGHYYSARELDRYPLPGRPLDFSGALSGDVKGRMRLAVKIDHSGRVVDLAVVDAHPPGVHEAEVREYLLHTSFTPGTKDGRPVNSRIVLELHAP